MNDNRAASTSLAASLTESLHDTAITESSNVTVSGCIITITRNYSRSCHTNSSAIILGTRLLLNISEVDWNRSSVVQFSDRGYEFMSFQLDKKYDDVLDTSAKTILSEQDSDAYEAMLLEGGIQSRFQIAGCDGSFDNGHLPSHTGFEVWLGNSDAIFKSIFDYSTNYCSH